VAKTRAAPYLVSVISMHGLITGIRSLPMIDRRIPAALALVFLPAAAVASQDLLKAKNCTACHHPERKMIGPAYKVIAEKYATDEAGQAALREKIRKGGGGVWGPSPMPPQPQVTEEDAATLVAYIMTLK
jgi:cytochrome c